MKKIALTLGVVASLYAANISDVVKQTLSTNPDILQKVLDYEVVKQNLKKVRAQILPTLDVVAKTGDERTKTVSNNFQKKKLNRKDLSIVLKQNIFAGTSTKHDKRKEKANLASAKYQAKNEATMIALENLSAYIDVLRYKELKELSRQNLTTHENILNKIKKEMDSGVKSKADYHQALSRKALAASSFVKATRKYKNALATYEKITDSKVEVTNLKPLKAPLVSQVGSLSSILHNALSSHPSILAARYDVTAQKRSTYENTKLFFANC
jgi:adhesin transport system outer membrane protein